jgi:adenylate kinase
VEVVEFMIPVAQPELAVLVEVEPEETTHRRQKEETEPQILVEVAAAVGKQHRLSMQAAPAVQVSSSSRPINNEDKWKPKSIGCMESTPQCTC